MKNNYMYSKDKIEAKINLYKNEGCGKAIMLGVHYDLKRLKDELEKFYSENIFYLSYYKSDAPYMGWNISDEGYKQMCKTTDTISEMFLDIYALVVIGLDKTMQELNTEGMKE